MPTLLQIVHGYPPREVAGTEIYAERLTRALLERGWKVHILASTRAPGKTHASWLPREDDGAGASIHRIVNNLPWRPLGQQEHDPGLQTACNQKIREIGADVVHVQHLLFLDIKLDYGAPSVLTLHDAWGWCARGGSLLEQGRAPCSGPSAEKCIPCYSAFSRGSAIEHQLGNWAGRLSAWVSPERMHHAWRKLPSRIRQLTQKGPAPKTTEDDFTRRQLAVREAFNRVDLRISPSAYLAQAAEANGIGPVQVIPHGVPQTALNRRPEAFVFLGSIAFHKGPDLVAQAWINAKKTDPEIPPLRIVGPTVEPACASEIPSEMREGPIKNSEVPALLSTAHALVLGSRWPENAPLVIQEARAAGCPVIAPQIGGIPELVQPDQDGHMYTPNDVESLTVALLNWRSFHTLPVQPPPTLNQHVDVLESHYLSLIG